MRSNSAANGSTPSPVGEGRGGVGLVIKNTGSWYVVRTDEGELYECKVKGNFRLRGIRTTNPVAVGDRVTIEPNAEGRAFITEILDRKNYIIRRASNLSKQSHIIAANIDMAFLVVTIAHPTTSLTFIDRFLAGAEAYRVPVTIVVNKVDLIDNLVSLDEESNTEASKLRDLRSIYEPLGYRVILTSTVTGQGIDELRAALMGISLFSGNSGVGKSTLLSALIPGLNLRTAEISEAHDTGMHTTTFSEMFEVPAWQDYSATPTLDYSSAEPTTIGSSDEGTNSSEANSSAKHEKSNVAAPAAWVIDTPGIKGFGTFDMEREEVSHYFREIFAQSEECRFNPCTHTHEPGCAVLRAVEEGRIAASRYASYLSMLDDKDESKYR